MDWIQRPIALKSIDELMQFLKTLSTASDFISFLKVYKVLIWKLWNCTWQLKRVKEHQFNLNVTPFSQNYLQQSWKIVCFLD